MIQANELRIGNMILLDTGFVLPALHYITGQDIADIASGKITLASIQPIPLTPAILEKCGFKEHIPSVFDIHGQMNRLRLQFLPNGCAVVYGASGCNWYDMNKDLKYLHELQNLYFVLTGKKLEIKNLVES